MDLIAEIINKIKRNPKSVVFPEGNNIRILKAADLAIEAGIARPILLGKKEEVVAAGVNAGVNVDRFTIVDPSSSPKLDEYITAYRIERDYPAGATSRLLQRSIYFGAMMLKQGDADAMVSGIEHKTESVIVASELIIGLKEGFNTPSGFLLMDIPGYSGPEGSLLIFADPAVNPEPTSEQLADIAIASADSAVDYLGWVPRIAMLSFSTKGSATHPLVDKVIEAVEIVKSRAPRLIIDGELQADAAIVPEVSQQKIKGESILSGKANILIFPDIGSANIAYKLVQRLAGAKAYGPILQGFTKPVTDLSRGASVEDILGATTLLVKRAQSL